MRECDEPRGRVIKGDCCSAEIDREAWKMEWNDLRLRRMDRFLAIVEFDERNCLIRAETHTLRVG